MIQNHAGRAMARGNSRREWVTLCLIRYWACQRYAAEYLLPNFPNFEIADPSRIISHMSKSAAPS
jgi:hypothetical protein